MPYMSHSEKISIALDLLFKDLMPSRISDSIREDPEKTIQTLFSIQESALIARDLFQKPIDGNLLDRYWAYLLFLEEAHFLARKSNLDALSAHYSAAFISLRSVLELIIKGAYYQCLCNPLLRNSLSSFRQNTKKEKFNNFVKELNNTIVSENLQKNSAGLYDEFTKGGINGIDLPSFHSMLKDLEKIEMLKGIENSIHTIYNELYRPLSDFVHVHPNKTDTGITLLAGLDIFEDKKIIKTALLGYMATLHKVMDVSIVLTLNILKELLQNEKVKEKVRNHLTDEVLFSDLKYAKEHMYELTS